MSLEPDCDIIVAGSGPAGGQFARYITENSDYSVSIVERDENIGDNDKSTAGSFREVVEDRNIPDYVVMDSNEDVVFESPNERAELPISNYVLDFSALQEFLVSEAEENGADVYTNADVKSPILEGDTVVGVKYSDRNGDEQEIYGNIVVDATGCDSALASDLGFFDKDSAQRGIGLEYQVVGKNDTPDSMVFGFDHSYAPGGYGWTFPAGEDRFKIGVCSVDDFREKHGSGTPIDQLVERWLDDERWEIDEIEESHAGEVISDNSINQRATDGFMAIGDAVSSINPLFGEGIRPGMESADMAAEVAIDALNQKNLTESKLREYERMWNEAKGRDWKIQRVVGELLYDFDESQQDEFIRKSDNLSEQQAESLRQYEMPLKDLASLYPFRIKDAKKLPSLVRHL